MDMQGPPITFDLLHSTDGGRHWYDVLRTPAPRFKGSIPVHRPAFPSMGGGPFVAPAAAGSPLTMMVSPTARTAWFEETDESDMSLQTGSTGNGGRTWDVHSYVWHLPGQRVDGLPLAQFLSLSALDGLHAWLLLRPFSGTSSGTDLFETDDAGGHWRRVALPTG